MNKIDPLKLIILDRDGVINEDSAEFIKSANEWRPLVNSLEAIALLNKHGYTVLVATNQSGLARGLFTETTLHEMHQKMQMMLEQVGGQIEHIYYCPHGPDDGCNCRKPKPGLLQKIADDFKISLNNVPMVGDSLRDLEAGCAVGCLPILVKTGKGKKTLSHALPPHTQIFEDLMDFALQLTDMPDETSAFLV